MKRDIYKILRSIERNLLNIEKIIVLYESNPNLDRGLLARNNSFFSSESSYCSCADSANIQGVNVNDYQKKYDSLIERFDKLTEDYFERTQMNTRLKSEKRKEETGYRGPENIEIKVISTRHLSLR